MEGHSFFLQLIAQGCGNLAKEEHLLYRELLLRYFIPYYAILDKHNYYRVFQRNSNNLFLIIYCVFVLIQIDGALFVAI